MKGLFIILIFSCSWALAQVPAAINYQGKAVTEIGTALKNQKIGLKLTLIEIGTENSVYQELHFTETNDLGLFSINIGEGGVLLGELASIDWADQRHALSVELDAEGGRDYTFKFSEELHFVPFAYYAETADTVYNLGQIGKQGPEGPQGERGVRGPQGPQGKRGRNVGQGPPGEPGMDGSPGPQGPQGLAGITYAARGDQGPKGPQGPPGIAQGDLGPQGPAGLRGMQGPPGDKGPKGAQGDPGSRGLQGERGPSTNEKGPQGPPGPRGPAGQPYYGPAGESGQDGIVCYECSPPYDDGCDTNGDGLYNVWDCAGPPGPQGDQGETGDPGPLSIYKMTSTVPSPRDNLTYIDDGTNTADGQPGFRFWDGTKWIDL